MGINPNEMKRLSFIKYLFESAAQQSKKPQPMASQSILTFHDSAELFLLLAADHMDVQDKSGIGFMEWWDRLGSKLDGDQELSQKRPMKKLHKARGNLKHHGIRPSEEDIEESRVHTKEFFENNTPLIFGIDFSEISLINQIADEEVREALKEAQELSKKDKEEAIKVIAMAFRLLMDKFEEKGTSSLSDPTFPLSKPPFLSLNNLDLPYEVEEKVREFTQETIKSIHDLQIALKIIALDIDYIKFVKFHNITPEVILHKPQEEGLKKYSFHASLEDWGWPTEEDQWTKEDIDFCIDFVIESAVTIQELEGTS